MIMIEHKELCTGCGACYSCCPSQCITMLPDKEGFLYPSVNEDKCMKCNLCEKKCPVISKIKEKNNLRAYAALNKDMDVRFRSTSGGIFYLLASYIISRGGVVCGVKMDSELKAIHDFAKTMQEVIQFQGSKYVQSEIGNSYKQVKEFLDEDRLVLFSGTPCQNAGLKAYIGKDDENLVCVDLICHGVPSPKVWRKYIALLERKTKDKITNISFRDKAYGWKNFSLKYSTKKNKTYLEKKSDNLYLGGFLDNLYLRPSCYSCEFKGINRYADITLGDFWGIENVLPELFDGSGTSLVLVNSKKGMEVIENIFDAMDYRDVSDNLEDILEKYNSAAIRPVNDNPMRKDFFDNMDNMNEKVLFIKYCQERFLVRVKRRAKNILKKYKY